MSRRTLALLLLSSCLFPQEKRKPVTIEAIGGMTEAEMRGGGFAAPVWAPDGRRFAYLAGGNIWLYDCATQSKKEAAFFGALDSAAVKVPSEGPFPFENRRVREERIQWFPDGRDLLLQAGGDLFVWHLETGKWDQLTATAEAERDAKLSPDGKHVSFRRANELFVMEVASKKVRQLTFDSSATIWNGRLDWVYPEELDLGTAHWWSPGSRQIAYLQFDVGRELIYPHADLLPVRPVAEPARYPKAGTPNPDVRLGVVGVSGGATRWMDLGDTRDALLARVGWLPDSRGVWVERLNRVQNRLDLLVADPATGAPRTLVHETDPTWINVTNNLRFLSDGKRLLWSSERTGFRHLYVYSTEGRLLKQVTRGDWEVSQVVGVDEQRGEVYYVSSEKDALERHLYRAGLNGKGKQQLTSLAGTHTVSMSPTCAFYIGSHSSLQEPARRSLHQADGKEVAVLEERNRKPLEEYQILPTGIVRVKAADGVTLYAKLVRPANFEAGRKYPAIVNVYGGPSAGQAVRDAWTGLGMDQVYAHRGFVVWQLDNRGTAGRGHQWESKLYRRLGRQELEDQKAGVAHLVSMGFVDPQRVGVTGWSYGGYMTLNCLLNAPEVFRAGVAGAPVTDWRNYDTIYTERYLGLPEDNEEGYKNSSPVNQAAALKGKLLLIHNFEDDNVLFQNSLQMIDALEKAGKQFDLMIYPQKSHGVTGPLRRHLNAASLEFFERTLK